MQSKHTLQAAATRTRTAVMMAQAALTKAQADHATAQAALDQLLVAEAEALALAARVWGAKAARKLGSSHVDYSLFEMNEQSFAYNTPEYEALRLVRAPSRVPNVKPGDVAYCSGRERNMTVAGVYWDTRDCVWRVSFPGYCGEDDRGMKPGAREGYPTVRYVDVGGDTWAPVHGPVPA